MDMPHRIDRLDAQIVALLQQDGRMPCAEIARRIGTTTERIVRHRIKRLVAENIIRVTTVVNPAAIGYTVAADVWVEAEAGAITEVASALTTLEQVSYVAYCSGERNISLQALAPDLAELHRLVTQVIGKMPGVTRTTFTIIPVILKDIHQWTFPRSTIKP